MHHRLLHVHASAAVTAWPDASGACSNGVEVTRLGYSSFAAQDKQHCTQAYTLKSMVWLLSMSAESNVDSSSASLMWKPRRATPARSSCAWQHTHARRRCARLSASIFADDALGLGKHCIKTERQHTGPRRQQP